MDTNVFSFDPVIRLLKDVIHEEENRHILQTDLKPMDYLLLHISTRFQDQQEADWEILKIWLQLVHKSLADAKNILHVFKPRQRCLGCLMCSPMKLTKQIEEWRVLFNYLFQGLHRDFSVFAGAQQIVMAPVIAPVIRLLNDVIHEEENRHIVRTELSPMENLLLDMNTVFTDQEKAGPETLNIWLQLRHNSLTLAKNILHRSDQLRQRQRFVDCLIFNPVRLSKEIKEWKVLFSYLFQGLQNDFSIFVSSEVVVKLSPFKALLEDVATSRIKYAQTQVETWLTEADHVRIIGVYGKARLGKTSLLNKLYNKYKASYVFDDFIWVTVPADYKTLESQALIAKEINLQLPHDSDIDTQMMILSAILKKKKFLLVLDDLWSPLDLQELGVAFGEGKQSKILFSTCNRDLIPLMRAEESIEIELLPTDDAWKLFRDIAFRGSSVSLEIEEWARRIADECRGSPLSLSVVAAAMNGKTSLVDWEISLNLMRTADPSFTDTHGPRVDQELYQCLRLSYDALPNSNVKNCFLYSAMFPKDHGGISVQFLVQLWMAEGLVRSKQENHLMDVATGCSYANLLVDRCLFKNFSNKESKNVWKVQGIAVHETIRDVAIYIGEEKENYVFKAGQKLGNFPDIHNEDCKRISLRNNDIENLPTEFTCPKLVSPFLSQNRIKDVPSVGQLKQLELLRLQNLSEIQDLPKEIGHLFSLKFLYLNGCSRLQSLPCEIGNLKKINIDRETMWSRAQRLALIHKEWPNRFIY